MDKNLNEYLHVYVKDDESPFMCYCNNEIDLNSLKPQWHEHLEIRYVLSGEIDFVCNSKSYNAKAGDIIVINPCERHMNRISNFSITRYNSIIIDIQEKYTGFLFDKYFAPIMYGIYKFPNVITDSRLQKMVIELFDILSKSDKINIIRAYSMFLQIVFYLENEKKQFNATNKKITNSQKRHSEIVDIALEYIFKHYAEQINLIDIAETCFITEAHLCRIFKKETGKSPVNFIIDFRINKAIIFMTNSELNIADVAEKCGFTDGAYFSRCFKKRMGMSPSEYIINYLSSNGTSKNKKNNSFNKKEKYLNIMEKALDCYTVEKIEQYYDEVKRNGLREHGFPRLTANIGILIAYGKCEQYKNLFCKMMDLCCELIPVSPEASNDFSVREICLCIDVLKRKNVFDKNTVKKWILPMKNIEPEKVYSTVATSSDDRLNNLAVFAAVSEFFRGKVCDINTDKFIDLQFSTQIKCFDNNGMYKDPGSPIVYDCISRLLFEVALHFGYHGEYEDILRKNIDRASEKTILYQSVSGEMPYGGRSMQFLHNEMWLAADYEYHATRLKNINPILAGRYKTAADIACDNLLKSIKLYGSHVKNCFPYDKKIGCENYAYFEKYMITVASAAYLAFLLADDEIMPSELRDKYIVSLGKSFNKLFVKGFDWFMEIDTNADFHYDANGIGRIHKKGCQPAIALSVPFPGKDSLYFTEKPNSMPMSLCTFIEIDGNVYYGSTEQCINITTVETTDYLSVSINRRINNSSFEETYNISRNYVELSQNAGEKGGFMLPVISFDGRNFSEITQNENEISVKYLDSTCTYSFDGTVAERNLFYNRNGEYKVFKVFCDKVKISIK